MRLVGTTMDSFETQGIQHQRRTTGYQQWQQIITEVKLPEVKPPTLATARIMCGQGDSGLDFDISNGSLIASSICFEKCFFTVYRHLNRYVVIAVQISGNFSYVNVRVLNVILVQNTFILLVKAKY